MKGAECGLAEYMQGANKRFIIPVYQRNYDWKLEDAARRLQDREIMIGSWRTASNYMMTS